MKFTVFGAGMMGRYIVNDLVSELGASILWVDRSQEALERGKAALEESSKVELLQTDISPESDLRHLFEAGSVAIGASSYEHHLGLTEMAIEQGASWLDLGGNNTVVANQRALDSQAKRKEVTVIPDCGLAPGMVSILGWDLHQRFENADTIELRVGGLPALPENKLGYQLVFSARGLINEYREPCTVLRDGSLREVAPLTELETLSIGERFPNLEAFTTSGGISTLAESLVGRVAHADYKTIRYPGHAQVISTMMELGFFTDRQVAKSGETAFDLSASILEKGLWSDKPDVVLVRADAKLAGQVLGRWTSIIDADGQWTAMQRSTGASAAVIAELIARGQVNGPGVLTQEEGVPASDYIDGLKRRGIELEASENL